MENKKIFELVKGFKDLKNDYENFNNPETIIKMKRDYKVCSVLVWISFFAYLISFFIFANYNNYILSIILNLLNIVIILMFISLVGLGLELNQLTFYILQNNKEEFLK